MRLLEEMRLNSMRGIEGSRRWRGRFKYHRDATPVPAHKVEVASPEDQVSVSEQLF